ncbi:MAG: hypothetical protein ACFFAN_08205 [Promethearchaeota archaeon]
MSELDYYLNDLDENEKIKNRDIYPRIHSIDFLKGIAICLIILVHAADMWIENNSRYIYGFLYAGLDVFGTSLLIFLSALTVIFLWKKKMGITPDNAIRNEILARSLIMIGLGMIYNFFTLTKFSFPLNLWGWNIFTFIGFAHIITYYTVKLSRGSRWIIGFIIFFITDPIRELLYLGKETNHIIYILHFIIVSPNPSITLLPYIALCFFSTIFGERILECLQLETIQAYFDTFKTLIKFGFIFLFLGLFFYGYPLVTPETLNPEEYPMVEIFPIIQNQPFYKFSGIPRFLIRGTAANLFYGLGMALLILGVSFYFLDIKLINKSFIRVVNFYGNVSLSLLLIHYVGLFLFFRKINIFFFFPIYFAYIGFLGFLMYVWLKYGKGVGTIEWILRKIPQIIKK